MRPHCENYIFRFWRPVTSYNRKMDCPRCGLLTSPEVLRCDCGYNLAPDRIGYVPEWQIDLAWRQKVAAFWAISWPAYIGNLVLVMLLMNGSPVDRLPPHAGLISFTGQLAFFGIQALLTIRLVRKNYRTFRVMVIRDDGSQSRSLSMKEIGRVWTRILWPQLALALSLTLLLILVNANSEADAARRLGTLQDWLRFLVAGPYGVKTALRGRYPGFRLQAYGYRYI